MKEEEKNTLEALEIFLKSFRKFIVQELEKSNPGFWETEFENALKNNKQGKKDRNAEWKDSVKRRGNKPTIELIDFKYLELFAENKIGLFQRFFRNDTYYLPTWLSEITKVRNFLDHYNSDLDNRDIAKAWIHMEKIAYCTGDVNLGIALKEIKERAVYRKIKRRLFFSIAILIISVGGFFIYYLEYIKHLPATDGYLNADTIKNTLTPYKDTSLVSENPVSRSASENNSKIAAINKETPSVAKKEPVIIKTETPIENPDPMQETTIVKEISGSPQDIGKPIERYTPPVNPPECMTKNTGMIKFINRTGNDIKIIISYDESPLLPPNSWALNRPDGFIKRIPITIDANDSEYVSLPYEMRIDYTYQGKDKTAKVPAKCDTIPKILN
ncbi:MAG TPA: hypothetical protein VJY62_09125 [Bacteroidia bacterium]|nr:hypothetical protein [Bacteroidia bacterium]